MEVIVIYHNITVTKEDARFNQLNSCTTIVSWRLSWFNKRIVREDNWSAFLMISAHISIGEQISSAPVTDNKPSIRTLICHPRIISKLNLHCHIASCFLIFHFFNLSSQILLICAPAYGVGREGFESFRSTLPKDYNVVAEGGWHALQKRYGRKRGNCDP